jgi:hypothetical protein
MPGFRSFPKGNLPRWPFCSSPNLKLLRGPPSAPSPPFPAVVQVHSRSECFPYDGKSLAEAALPDPSWSIITE